MVNEALGLTRAFATGALLGASFFVGLWCTVRWGLSSDRAALWFLGSMLLRTSIVLLGLHLVLGNDWSRLVAGLAGFIAARVVATRPVRMTLRQARSAGHAP